AALEYRSHENVPFFQSPGRKVLCAKLSIRKSPRRHHRPCTMSAIRARIFLRLHSTSPSDCQDKGCSRITAAGGILTTPKGEASVHQKCQPGLDNSPKDVI